MGTILNDEDIRKIHRNSIEILEVTGVKIDHSAVLERLNDNGCTVDFQNHVVRIPGDLVEKCLSWCPSSIKISDRARETVTLGPGAGSVFWSGNALYCVEGGAQHEITRERFIRLIKTYDALTNVDGIVGVSLSDVPPQLRDVAGFRLMAEYSGKHLRPCIFRAENSEAIQLMAEVLLDGREYTDSPVYSLGYSNCSPLHWTETALQLFLYTAGRSIPLTINSECMLGGTSPVTLAGALSLGNAEILSGIVINQLFEKGRPLIHNLGFSHVLDMQTSLALTGAPECALIGAAGADIAHYYNLPSAAWMSSDSLHTDSQAGYEHMLLALAFLDAGVNVIWGAGQLEAQLSLSAEQAVIDDDIIGCAKRYARGIEVNAETLALDLIKETGIAGDFLSTEHTSQHFKKELSFCETAWRNRREAFNESGGRSIAERAADRVDAICKTDKVYITDNQRKELDSIEKSWFTKYGYNR